MRGLSGVSQVTSGGGPPHMHFDYQCPLASLPLAFGTRLDTIPAEVPYLKASPRCVEQWSRRLGRRDRPRVGIAWSGSLARGNDVNRAMELTRLLPLRALGVQLIALQKDMRDQDRQTLEAHPDILYFDGEFSDTAALIGLADIIITIDTALAHLAGALGAPTWVMLPFAADWRWLRERDDSPWYPTARLFRQPRYGDWDSVIQQILRELPPWIERRAAEAGACSR